MILDEIPHSTDPLREAVRTHYRIDEAAYVETLLERLELPPDQLRRIERQARELVSAVRKAGVGKGGVDAFMQEYELSSKEGVVLMCLAEALLRVPDSETADRLIRDKLTSGDWREHLGESDSLFVNASTLGLMLTGNVLRFSSNKESDLRYIFGRLVARSGEPVVRQAVRRAMETMGRQFVLGRTINEALKKSRTMEEHGYRYSYDMLGEGARTDADARRYFESYAHAIDEIGKHSDARGVIDGPGISVKLSALHPRYEFGQMKRVMCELVPRVRELALAGSTPN